MTDTRTAAQIPDEAVQAALETYLTLKSGGAYAKMKRSLTAALPHLSAPCAVEVPEGWQLVPKDTTFEMAKAAIDLDPKSDLDAKYKAMLSAAPQVVTKPVDVAAVQDGGHSDIIERLNGDIAQLLRMIEQAKMAGAETGVRVKSPELLLKDITDAVSTFRALSAEPAQGEQWREMEDAPKGFEAVDLWLVHPSLGGERATGCLFIEGAWLDDTGLPFNTDWVPTHWMPLPAAPTPEAGK